METQTIQVHALTPQPTNDNNHHSNVDASRPFSSVKEAIAIFGQRILSGEIQSLNPIPRSPNLNPNPLIRQAASPSPPPPSLRHSSPKSPQNTREEFLDTLKKLEAELKETKTELRMLKERESETEIAVASLNAELHKNMSKLAKAEADAAAKSALAVTKTVSFDNVNVRDINGLEKEEARRKELMRRMESEYPTLAQILGDGGDDNSSEREGYFGKKQKKKMTKNKPIVPLVGDFFFKKKGASADISAHLYASPKLY